MTKEKKHIEEIRDLKIRVHVPKTASFSYYNLI